MIYSNVKRDFKEIILSNYNSKDLVVLEGLEAVRLRPGMYIGTTGVKGLHHILWEIVDNGIDELANGFGNKLIVRLYKDGSISVQDNGRGVPVDKHPTLGISGVEVVFTQLHAGGKFNTDNYQFSGGLHGVGASVTNALSEWLEVITCKEGKKYRITFESVPNEKGKILGGTVKTPLKMLGTTKDSGTFVHFMPDARIFETIHFNPDVIIRRLRELAFLNKGIEIVFENEKAVNENGDIQILTFKYDGGLGDFATYLNEGKEKQFQPPIYIEAQSKKIKLECAIQYTDTYVENIFSYVNNIPTTEGGTHETGFKTAFTRALNDVARSTGLLKEKDANLLGEDYREGMTAVLAIKMNNIQFEGQTKTKLGNPEAKTEVEQLIYTHLVAILEKSENKKILDIIIGKAKKAESARIASKKAKELTRAKNSLEYSSLIGKLSACSGKKRELNELFIVEGDSAGGSAKQGRDRSFQAILPLRGKPLNVEKKRIEQVLANEEFRSLITALGAGIGDDLNLSNLRYNKVIILSDADQDGAHIRAILLTFFYRYMKELILDGHVYIGVPPLYKISKKDTTKYCYSDEELRECANDFGKNYAVQRYKGLGEMNPEQLWETTMDPKSRLLIQVSVEDAAEAEKMITTLMGDDIDSRKSYIQEYANFNKVDNELLKKKN